MARLISRPFDPTQPVYARRFFVAAGRHYEPGDRFDWQRLSVAQRRVFLLYEAGKLTHEAGEKDASSASVGKDLITSMEAALAAVKATPKPVEQEVQDHEILTAATEGGTGETMQPVEEPGPVDELDDLTMKELRVIAEAEGAPYRTSRELQRQAIREHRDGSADA